MKDLKKITALVLLAFVLLATSCSASKGAKGCGCPSKKGMVGY